MGLTGAVYIRAVSTVQARMTATGAVTVYEAMGGFVLIMMSAKRAFTSATRKPRA